MIHTSSFCKMGRNSLQSPERTEKRFDFCKFYLNGQPSVWLDCYNGDRNCKWRRISMKKTEKIWLSVRNEASLWQRDDCGKQIESVRCVETGTERSGVRPSSQCWAVGFRWKWKKKKPATREPDRRRQRLCVASSSRDIKRWLGNWGNDSM